MAGLKRCELQLPGLLYPLGAFFALTEKGGHFRLKCCALRVTQAERCIRSRDCGLKRLLPHAGQRTALRVATVVDVTLLQFAYEGIPALGTFEHAAVEEEITVCTLLSFAGEDRLNTIEER